MTNHGRAIFRTLDVLSKIAGIAAPIVIAYYGYTYTKLKDDDDRRARKIDRAVALLTHLTSDHQVERQGAMTVIETLQKTGEFAPELVATIKTLQSSALRDSPEAANCGRSARTSKNRPKPLSVVQNELNVQPPNAADSCSREDQRQAGEIAVQYMKSRGFLVPGVQVVPSDLPPRVSELRYFHSEEGTEVKSLADQISRLGLPMKETDLSRNNYKATPRHYEIVLSDAATIIPQRPLKQ